MTSLSSNYINNNLLNLNKQINTPLKNKHLLYGMSANYREFLYTFRHDVCTTMHVTDVLQMLFCTIVGLKRVIKLYYQFLIKSWTARR